MLLGTNQPAQETKRPSNCATKSWCSSFQSFGNPQKQITLKKSEDIWRHLKTSEDSQDVTTWRVQTWITWITLLLDQRCSMLNDGPADALHPRCPSSTWRPADADSNAKFFMRITQVHHVLSVGFISSASILAWKKSTYCSAKAKASSAKPSLRTLKMLSQLCRHGQNDNLSQRKGNDSSGTRAKSWRLGRSGVLEM